MIRLIKAYLKADEDGSISLRLALYVTMIAFGTALLLSNLGIVHVPR